MLNVLIPLGSPSQFFKNSAYVYPSPLIDILGKPMIQHVVETLDLDGQYIFLVQKNHRIQYHLDDVLDNIAPGCIIVDVDGLTEGAASTSLLAKELIDNDSPLVIANSDQILEYEINNFHLLKNLTIEKTNQVWATTDITYIRMNDGFTYFLAIIDLYSRFILSAYLSTSLEADFCVEILKISLNKYKNPEIFNTDQGSQFTSKNFLSVLTDRKIKISMDAKGRALDNVFIERESVIQFV